MSLAFVSMELLWRNALGAIPLALAVVLICRCIRCRPSTRHALWLIVLIALLAPPLSPALDLSNHLGVDQVAQRFGLDRTIAVPNGESQVVSPSESAAAVGPPVRSAALPRLEIAHSAQLPAASDATMSDCSPPMLRSPASPLALSTAGSLAECAPMAAVRPPDPIPAPAAVVDPARHAAATPPPFPAPLQTVRNPLAEWREWMTRLLEVRASVVGVAPLPASLWLAGLGVIAVVMFGRTWRFSRLLRETRPAEEDVSRDVEECAAALSLRRVPEARMTDRAISPLVWCSWRRTLVLPGALWRELDATGRRAVLLHELAHLRRRDHWICWLELLACALHWWNPLVWWARRRLRDEADFCCDAWVTAVMPAGRTAYARALLTTRQHVFASPLAPPALALGATSARSKRFARRLTMVMTERSAPRLSMCGSAVAICLALGAWLATPLWACPPEESAPKATAKSAQAGKAKVKVPHVVVTPGPSAPVAVSPGAAASTYEQHLAARAAQEGAVTAAQAPRARSGGGDDDRISRLEDRMDRLTAQLERLIAAQAGGQAAAPVAPQPPRAASPARPAPPAPPAPPAARGQAGPRGVAPRVATPPGAMGGGAAAPAPGDGETIIRFYELPNDKAHALFEFMRRDDVPVLVASRDGGIEVHGTARQHEIFAMFIRLIHPEAKIDGQSRMHRAVEELSHVALLEATRSRQSAGQTQQVRERLQAAHEQMNRTRQQRGEELRRAMEQQRQHAQQHRHDLHNRLHDLHRRADELRRKAEELREKASGLKDDPEQARMLAQADSVDAEADALESQADAQEQEADARMDAVEAEMEAQQEVLEDELEAQAEALEAELEAEMAALEAAETANPR